MFSRCRFAHFEATMIVNSIKTIAMNENIKYDMLVAIISVSFS